MSQSWFEIEGQADSGRAGVLHTAHGDVATPALCVTGSGGLTADELLVLRVQLLGVSAFEAKLQPESAAVARQGGIHRFLRWSGPVLADAGSTTIFGLTRGASGVHGRLDRVTEDGVSFASPFNGSSQYVTPESSARGLAAWGADLVVPLFPVPSTPIKLNAVSLSTQWAERAREALDPAVSVVLGISSSWADDTVSSVARSLAKIDVDGFSLATGEDRPDTTTAILAELDPARLRHLANICSPDDAATAVTRGFDLLGWNSTADADRGQAFTRGGGVALTEPRHADDVAPLDPDCRCPACAFSRAYLHHLFAARELLGPRLVALHNLTYMTQLLEATRALILARVS